MTDHLELARHYAKCRDAYDELKRRAEFGYRQMKKAEATLIDGMLKDRVNKFEVDDGGSPVHFSMRQYFGVSVTKENEFEVRDWLTETQGDVALFEKTVLNKEEITKVVKKMDEAGEEVPDFLHLNKAPGLVVRGWKERAKE